MRTCVNCGRKLYKNELCSSCLNEINIKNRIEYFQNHPEMKLGFEWWEETERMVLKERKLRVQENRKSNTNYALASKLRGRLRYRIRNCTESKLDTYDDLIGCSIRTLMAHLESKFSDNMTWSNYGLGGWQIDHIIPCSSFKLSDIDEQKKCFHFKNLQPLWAMENFHKNRKVISNRKSKRSHPSNL